MPRSFEKPPGVVRIALLGDSMVAAAQVPFHKTAGHVFEQKLNALAKAGTIKPVTYEALNFGTSNFGIGQYLLTWEEYASKFDPDYVFILVAGYLMDRTMRKTEEGRFATTRKKELWIRPTFRLENDVLIREPARDFDEFVKVQEELRQQEFGGERILRRPRKSMVVDFMKRIYNFGLALNRKLYSSVDDRVLDSSLLEKSDIDEQTLLVNLKVIEELGQEVGRRNGTLVIVDAARYSNSSDMLSQTIERFCTEKRFGYVPLSDYLLKANKNGIATRWVHDGHFNEAGNAIFAEAIYDWMVRHVGRGDAGAR
jgi:hypothetical protein